MTDENSRPVVVGIDGSKSAVRAAAWAAEEAADRDSTLLLLHAVDLDRDDQEDAMAGGRHALTEAWEAVLAAGVSVKVESDIVYGDAAQRLVEASRDARMVCVGDKGTHNSAPGHRGATAAEVAEKAACTAAIVRHHRTPYDYQWVVAVLDEWPQSHVVFQTAINEAMLRKAALLALTAWPTTAHHRPDPSADDLRAKLNRYLDDSDGDDADLQVCALPMPDHIFNMLEQSVDIDQLVVVGTSNPELVGELLSRRASKILRKSNCSVMIARGDGVD